MGGARANQNKEPSKETLAAARDEPEHAREEMRLECDIKTITSGSTGESARVEQLITNVDIPDAGTIVGRVYYNNTKYVRPERLWNTIEVGPISDGTKSVLHANIGYKLLKANHSYSPNCRLVFNYEHQYIDSVTEQHGVLAGTPLSWNYTTSEWEMDEQFTDWQIGKPCQGFRLLPKEEQQRTIVAGEACPHIYSQYLKAKMELEQAQ